MKFLKIFAIACCIALPSCTSIHQPMSQLQRPYVIDRTKPNFSGTKIAVQCSSTNVLNGSELELQCGRLRLLFEAQDAQIVDKGQDFLIEAESWMISEDSNWWMWLISVPTFTFFPVEREYTVGYRVIVKDSSGFLLKSEVYESRFINFMGLGFLVPNTLLNWFVRDEKDKINGNRAAQDFSNDYYGRVSQIAYNAKIRAKVLRASSEETK